MHYVEQHEGTSFMEAEKKELNGLWHPASYKTRVTIIVLEV